MKGLLRDSCSDMVLLNLYVPEEGPGSTSTSKGVLCAAYVGSRLTALVDRLMDLRSRR